MIRITQQTARQLGAAAGIGFVAGFCTLAMLIWYFGNFVGLRPARFGPTRTVAADAKPGSVPPLHPPEPPAATSGGPVPGDGAPVAAPPPRAEPTIGPDPVEALRDRRLAMPVEGVQRSALVRSYSEARGNRSHEAIDILAPRNTPVLAVEDGTIAKLFTSRYGGLTIYQFDPEKRFIYYYAHLERYARGLEEGQKVRRGQVIGHVGTSGNAPPGTPHLHFAIFRALEPPRWWEGTPLDPYDVLR
jgi:murein DD-endopeptidase MepM/ murein hydrolase activator NlpD